MKAIITGYGRMGREIEGVLVTHGHKVSARIDPSGSGDYRSLDEMDEIDADVAIEFSLPQGVLRNMRFYGEKGIPVVLGTTGWESDHNAIVDIVVNYGGAAVFGSNFSIGAHIFFRLCARTARLVDNIEEYDLSILERHHRFKKDSPSGTAKTAARKVLENSSRKKRITTDRLDRMIEDDELHVASIRGGAAPGCHILTADSIADTLEVIHTARSRIGFAVGAVKAAEWIIGREGFYDVDDFIDDLLSSEEDS